MGLRLNDASLPYFNEKPLLVEEVGDFDAGDGIRVSLESAGLLVEVATQGGGGCIQIPLLALLDALVQVKGGQA